MSAPPPIITTIASSEYFSISTAGSAYFYPKILDSNLASLSSESNADGNGSSFGHFYKSLLSTSSLLLVANQITFCNICNYAGDSTATVSLWTSTGKYLQVPLVGPTAAIIRKNMIAKEGVIINTVSTSSLYSTIVLYLPDFPPESDFIFKEGTYSTIIAQNVPATPGSNYLSFADIVYLNCHTLGLNITFTSDYYSAGDYVTIDSGGNWDNINTTLDYFISNATITPKGNLFFTTYCSNATASLRLNLSMCNLAPATFYRLCNVYDHTDVLYPDFKDFVNVSVCNFDAIQFPGTNTDYLSNSSDLKYYNSGSVCIFSQPLTSEGKFPLFNFGDSYNYESDSKQTEDIITFGPNVISNHLPDHSFTDWHLATVTYSNYIQNCSNYYDLYAYYNAGLQFSSISNVGHTSSFISNYNVVGCNYPGALMNYSIFDRCLCKREIELYLDLVYSVIGGGTGGGTGSGGGGGGGGPH